MQQCLNGELWPYGSHVLIIPLNKSLSCSNLHVVISMQLSPCSNLHVVISMQCNGLFEHNSSSRSPTQANPYLPITIIFLHQERLTLRHRNTSKWARRALKRGVEVMDAGTKEALAEQLRMGQALRRKIEGRGEGDSDDDSDETR